ncbi:hypothetical protein EC991_002328 [Linnemannia zychae]|nr:hypothetical protein EC991_002328 [Linnemannia zychae]
MHIMAPQSIAEPTPVPTSAPVSTPLEQILPVLDQQRQRVTPTEVAESQILDQTRGRSQSRSSDDSAPNEQVLIPQQHQQQHQHNSNSPRIKIKSEEREESVQKRHLLGGEYKVGQDSKSWPLKYADFDIIIDIPSSVGSDIGLSGQPESSNAYERRCQEGKCKEDTKDSTGRSFGTTKRVTATSIWIIIFEASAADTPQIIRPSAPTVPASIVHAKETAV